MIAWVRTLLDQQEETSPGDSLRRLAAGLEDRAVAAPSLRAARPYLAALLDLPVEELDLDRLPPLVRFENTLLALEDLVRAECRQGPVVLHLEDGHWADPDTHTFLETLARSAGDLPLALVASCRPSDTGAPVRFSLGDMPKRMVALGKGTSRSPPASTP